MPPVVFDRIVARLVDDGSEYRPDDIPNKNVYTTTMDFPFSIYVWHAPHKLTDRPFWQEELRASTQQWAIYAAGLLYNAGVPHQDTVRERPVIKVVREGKILLALPDAHTVELCEKQIALYKEHPPDSRRPSWTE